MIRIRRSEERGHFEHRWLDTYHTFSFEQYYDPEFMGFRALRVINEDRILPAKGFGRHPHRDMEIVTWILDGSLEHRDSMGNGSIIRPDEAQRMSAGTGVEHSEYNPSSLQAVHLLQIWILPEKRGLPPSYEQKSFPRAQRLGRLRPLASSDGREDSVVIHQDAAILAGALAAGEEVLHGIPTGRHAWIQVTRGRVGLDGQELSAGDGAAVSDEESITLSAREETDLLLFDLG